MKAICTITITLAFLSASASSWAYLEIKELPQDERYGLIAYREVADRHNAHELGFHQKLKEYDHWKISTDAQRMIQNAIERGLPLNEILYGSQEYYLYVINPGYLIIGRSVTGVSYIRTTINYANYVIRREKNMFHIPVVGWSITEVMLLAPGIEMIKINRLAIDETTDNVVVRGSEENAEDEVVTERNEGRRLLPVPRPDNEETAELRGTVRVGDGMAVATRRLAQYEKGKMAHPPADAAWTHLWKVEDGLLAVMTNQDGTVVEKMGYILGQDSEEPVAIELSRIHLTDGEMIMPLPDPPGKPAKETE